MTQIPENRQIELVELTADLVSAYVSNNPVPVSDLSALVAQVHHALKNLGATAEETPHQEKPAPAISVRKSVTPDHIVCLEDGKKFKSLKRHLATHHGMTPEGYRARWNLPADYPMVAPNYAEKRRALAKKIGLGRKPKVASAPAARTKKGPASGSPTQERGPGRPPRAKRSVLTPAFAPPKDADAG